MKIFELFVNLSPTIENQVFRDKAGAYVNVYVASVDLEHSIDKMKEFVKSEGFQVKEIEHVRVVDLEEWEDEREGDSPTEGELSTLLGKDTAIYGAFHSYEFEHEH